ncbi:hypothetical protein [Wolbachia endosymbiont of Litomosoides brasiliensis]|nr:hypothetical protein [Wolbachia endosymbiont of Litomosoides brasiliensis]
MRIGMRNKNREKFGLSVSKSIACLDMQKMKFSYITSRPVCNEQDEGR